MARVVIVDDDEAYAYVLAREAEAAGYGAVVFHDWRGVLELMESDEPVDVLVTDMRLPAGTPNGLSLARMALARQPQLKVVYMTAFSELQGELRDILPGLLLKTENPGQDILPAIDAPAA